MAKWYLLMCVITSLFTLAAGNLSFAAAELDEGTLSAIVGGCPKCVDPTGYCTTHCYAWFECRGDGELFCTQKRRTYTCKETVANPLKPCVQSPNQSRYCGEIHRDGGCEHDLGWPDYCSGGTWVSDNCPGDYATGDPC